MYSCTWTNSPFIAIKNRNIMLWTPISSYQMKDPAINIYASMNRCEQYIYIYIYAQPPPNDPPQPAICFTMLDLCLHCTEPRWSHQRVDPATAASLLLSCLMLLWKLPLRTNRISDAGSKRGACCTSETSAENRLPIRIVIVRGTDSPFNSLRSSSWGVTIYYIYAVNNNTNDTLGGRRGGGDHIYI